MDFVSEITRSPWSEVYAMTAIEFLTLICYGHDKQAYEAEEKRKYLRQH